ncbi:ribonuclease P protein component [Rhodobacteraceae bacterium CCMM004]|nr:ribonuclease P protein component [Rhodobacteraceae bacterium CCMM004]
MPTDAPADSPSRGPLVVERLRKRPDFLRAARGLRQATPGFVLQARDRGDGDAARVGFTCSKKVGNAVARNRAKRRLREIARLTLPAHGRPGWDYVLIGRAGVTAGRDFAQMRAELEQALAVLHPRCGAGAGTPE